MPSRRWQGASRSRAALRRRIERVRVVRCRRFFYRPRENLRISAWSNQPARMRSLWSRVGDAPGDIAGAGGQAEIERVQPVGDGRRKRSHAGDVGDVGDERSARIELGSRRRCGCDGLRPTRARRSHGDRRSEKPAELIMSRQAAEQRRLRHARPRSPHPRPLPYVKLRLTRVQDPVDRGLPRLRRLNRRRRYEDVPDGGDDLPQKELFQLGYSS